MHKIERWHQYGYQNDMFSLVTELIWPVWLPKRYGQFCYQIGLITELTWSVYVKLKTLLDRCGR